MTYFSFKPSLEDLLEIVSNLPGFIYQLRMDSKGTFSYPFVGPGVESMFMVKGEQVLKNASVLLDMIHPDDWQRVLRESLEAAERLVPWHSEFRMILPDGRVIWIEASDTPHRSADGVILWNGYANDITPRKRLEAALQASEHKFRAFVENVNDIIYTLDREGRITYVSPMWEEKLGQRTESVLGNRLQDLIHQDDVAQFFAFLNQVMELGLKQEGFEYRVRNLDGEWRWHMTNAAPVFDQSGNIKELLGIAHDITGLKRTEEHIRYLAHHDTLTRLPNREYFYKHLEESLEVARRSTTSMALMYVDLDWFKPVNDEHGHAVGDLLLKAVAKRMKGALRGSDFVGRVGGDEFVILLSSIQGEEDALWVANKIRQILSKPFRIGEHRLKIGCSIGLALFPMHGGSGSELMRYADQAMYLAKNRGRNCCVVYVG